MSINYESIEFSADEWYRVLRWETDVNSTEVYDSSVGRFCKLEGVGSQWHRHSEVELTLIETGIGIRVVGDQSTEMIGHPNVVLLGRGLPHYWQFSGPSSGACIQFSDVRLMDLLTEAARLEVIELIDRASFGLELSTEIRNRVKEGMIELTTDDPISCVERTGMVMRLLGVLIGASRQDSVQISSSRFDGLSSDSNYVEMQTAIGWIMENFQSQIRLADALEVVHMSKASFSRHFLKCTGLSFGQFVNDLRISHACKLLHSSQLSVSQIALRSGFENLSNFNRVFRDRKEVTPSQYRKRSGRR